MSTARLYVLLHVLSLTKAEIQQYNPDSKLGNFLLCLNAFKSEFIPFQLGGHDFLAMSCTLAHNILRSASVIPEFIYMFSANN